MLAAGYTFTLFDGLSRFYVSAEHLELVAKLSYPACVLDDFEPAQRRAQGDGAKQATRLASATARLSVARGGGQLLGQRGRQGAGERGRGQAGPQ